jgi:HEAT repeat protein
MYVMELTALFAKSDSRLVPAPFYDIIQGAVAHIVELLTDSDSNVRSAGTDAISKLAGQRLWWQSPHSLTSWYPFLAAFHDTIQGAVPQIVSLLKDSHTFVQSASARSIGQLAEHRM